MTPMKENAKHTFTEFAAVVTLLAVMTVVCFVGLALSAQDTSDRERAGLRGPVRRVRVEVATMRLEGGRPVEGPRYVTEDTSFDEEGARVRAELNPFPEPETKGKVLLRHSDDGRPIERSVFDENGTLKRREQFTYSNDSWGNWTLQWTMLSITADGKATVEPVRAVHRQITYFYEQPKAEPTAEQRKPPPVVEERPARALQIVKPIYPPAAQAVRIRGLVVVAVEVDEQGKVTDAEIVEGHTLFRDAALAAARRSRFEPATRDGKPVPGQSRITYNFTPER